MSTTLKSYSQMHTVEPKEVFVPHTIEELRTKIMECDATGRRVTFRAKTESHSFDEQALNDDVVIIMEKLNEIGEPSREKLEITVGPGARWGDIVEKTLEAGLVSPIVVTTPDATAAGTLAANCLTRGTYRYGSQGMQTKCLTLLTPSGNSLDLSPDDDQEEVFNDKEKPIRRSDLFHAVVQGYGYLGAITSITFKLISVAVLLKEEVASGEVGFKSLPAVERSHVVTTPHRFRGFEELIELFEGLLRRLKTNSPDLPNDAYSIVFRNDVKSYMGFFFETSYDTQESKHDQELKGGLIFYKQHEIAEALKRLFGTTLGTGTLGDTINKFLSAAFNSKIIKVVEDGQRYQDQYDDYTFMTELMDVVRKILHGDGTKPPTIQQTFVLPKLDDEPDVPHRNTLAFLKELETIFEDKPDFRPSFFDIGYIGGGDRALLSATHGKPSFGISVALDADIGDTVRQQAIIELFKDTSVLCDKHGGTVHLIKNVYCEDVLLRKMYGARLKTFESIKKTVDPRLTLRNNFFDRLFGDM